MGICGSDSGERRVRERKPVKLNETENAILKCKTCRDKIKQFIKKLEIRLKNCREKAKQLLISKERDRAKFYLRQGKLHQEQIKLSEGQLDMVENQIRQIESAQNLQECLACLKQGNEVLNKLQSTIKIEEWEKVKDDMDELKEKDKEISNYLKEYGINEAEYDEEVNNDYDKLLKEIEGGDKIDLPNVPKEEITEDKNKNKEEKVGKIKNKKKVIEA